AVSSGRRDGPLADDRARRPDRVSRQASRRDGRFPRGLRPRPALAARSRASRRGGQARRAGDQAKARAVPGLVLYEKGLLPRSGCPAQPRGAAEKCRSAARSRLSAQKDRRAQIHRSEPRQGGGPEAGEIARPRVSIAGMEEIYTFGGNPLDRASGRRTDRAWIAGLLADPETRILPMRGLKPLLREGNEPALDWQPVALWRGLIDAGATLIFLGLNEGRAFF